MSSTVFEMKSGYNKHRKDRVSPKTAEKFAKSANHNSKKYQIKIKHQDIFFPLFRVTLQGRSVYYTHIMCFIPLDKSLNNI